jgi:hypothetical protein
MKAAGIERELWPVLDANSQTLLPAIFGAILFTNYILSIAGFCIYNQTH